MKTKGTREPPPTGKRHLETTRDDRIKVISLRDSVGWSWSRIGAELNIDRRTCQKVSGKNFLWQFDTNKSC